MFFNVELLCRKKKGRFATIWIAANRGIKHISQNDVMAVNVVSTCDQILEYVMSKSTSPKDRLSLCLSIKLIHGTMLVYRQQVVLLQQQILSFFVTIKRPLPIRESRFLDDAAAEGARTRPKRRSKPKKTAVPAVEEPRFEIQQIDERELDRQLRDLPFSSSADLREITLPEEVALRVPQDENDLLLFENLLGSQRDVPVATASAQEPVPATNEIDESAARKRRLSSPHMSTPAKRPRLIDSADNVSLEPNIHVVERGQLSPETPLSQRVRERYARMMEAQREHEVVSPMAAAAVPPTPPTEAAEPPAMEAALVQEPAQLAPPAAEQVPPARGRGRGGIRRPPANRNYSNLVVYPNVTLKMDRPKTLEYDLFKIPASAETTFSFEIMQQIVNEILTSGSQEMRAEVGHETLTDSALAGLVAAADVHASTMEQSAVPVTHPELSAVSVEAPARPTRDLEITPQRISSPHLSRIEAPTVEGSVVENIAEIHPIRPKQSVITEVEPQPPRVHTSTPFTTESRRHANLLTLLRNIFRSNNNAPVKLEEICFPLNRYKVATTFHDLLNLKAKQYVALESLPDSIELHHIKPGPRLWNL